MNDIKIADLNTGNDIVRRFLNATLKEMMSVTSAECSSLFIFDAQQKELILDSFYNSVNANLHGLKQRMGEGISGKIADIRAPVLVKDIDSDIRFKRNGFNHYKTRSFISIPLFTSRGLIGLINLADKSSGEPFCENDLEFAVTISRYTCLTIDSFCQKETLGKQKLLLEKYASMGKLAAGIVHEINNPLDGVIRYVNILLDQNDGNSITQEYLVEAKRGLNRIANITKSLLEFSHQLNSSSSQLKKYVNLHQLIDESLDSLSNKLNGRIQVERRYKDNLPKILDLGLSHVIINIIENALDAMADRGRLKISTDIKDSMVEVSFQDTGPGVPEEIKERIFEPFFTTKSIDKGTGLGLAICNEIINKYRGSIEVRSTPGEGSIFTISIPKNYLENA